MPPISPRRNGAGRRTTSPGAAPTRCPAPSGCSCRCSTGRGAVGVVGIDRDEPGPILTPDQHRLLDALADQAALAIERVNLVEDVDRARLVAETDRLRAALLTSISHDLRTPLASILGSATSLATHGDALDAATRLDLIAQHPGRGGAAQSFHRQPAGHDAAGIRAAAAAHRRDRTVRRDRQRVAARRQDPGGAPHAGACCSPTCRCSISTRCCSSRCCSICWTTPANMRRPDR